MTSSHVSDCWVDCSCFRAYAVMSMTSLLIPYFICGGAMIYAAEESCAIAIRAQEYRYLIYMCYNGGNQRLLLDMFIYRVKLNRNMLNKVSACNPDLKLSIWHMRRVDTVTLANMSCLFRGWLTHPRLVIYKQYALAKIQLWRFET